MTRKIDIDTYLPGTQGTIHSFALLHLAMVLLCRSFDIKDEIWLTLLTITMVVIIGLRHRVKVEIITAGVIVANLLAYFLGIYGAKFLGLFLDSDILIHALSSFLTTEIIGFGTNGILVLYLRKAEQIQTEASGLSPSHVVWLVAAMTMVLLFRIALTLLFPSGAAAYPSIGDIAGALASNSLVMVLSLSIIVLLTRGLRLWIKLKSSTSKTLFSVLALTGLSVGIALCASMGLIKGIHPDPLDFKGFSQVAVVALGLGIIAYSLVYMVDYIITAKAAMQQAKLREDYVRFQYMRLKQQVNPHFLFNSLNVLDALVQDGQNESASVFIHKLAGVYRYLIRNDDRTVPLRDEMKFVELYVDLLKVRFPEGFEVSTDIPESGMALHVIPCSVQMLLENVFKHNRIDPDEKLTIKISCAEDRLTVSNNLRPKFSAGSSTHIGLENLKQQYKWLCGRTIEVSESTDNVFSVKIPLITPQQS